jgi:divalent metal cation (Fe/Co/Zn/Cd) transporter
MRVDRLRAPFRELLDASLSPQSETDVRHVACSVADVICVEKCFVRKMGLRFYVELHMVVNGSHAVRQGHDLAHLVKARILDEVPRISEVLIHVEPEEEVRGVPVSRAAFLRE